VTASTKAVALDDIIIDERCQARVEMTQEAVDHYAELERDDVKLPPIEVVDVAGDLVLVDGFHRAEACRKIGKAFVRVRIVGTGDLEFASWTALSKNHAHGVRRTREDKRKAVWLALDNGIGQEQSSREIARHLGVSDPFVSKIRKQWEAKQAAKSGDDASAGANVSNPNPVDDADEAQAADLEPEGSIDRQLANDYAKAAKGLGSVYRRLCADLGAVDGVCVKVREAKQLAEASAKGATGG